MPALRPTTPHLLGIPGELRNQIYEDHLVLMQPVSIYKGGQEDHDDPFDNSEPPLYWRLMDLFLTCGQIHREASGVFYSRNRFVLPPISSCAPHQVQANFLMRWFLDRIGPRNAASLRNLMVPFPLDLSTAGIFRCLDHDDDDDDDWNHTLIPSLRRRCPNLETLELDMRWNNHWVVPLLSADLSAPAAAFGRLDGALRAAFPSLRQVRLHTSRDANPSLTLERRGPDESVLTLSYRLGGEASPERQAEWARFEQAVLAGPLGWAVDLWGHGQANGYGWGIPSRDLELVARWCPAREAANLQAPLYPAASEDHHVYDIDPVTAPPWPYPRSKRYYPSAATLASMGAAVRRRAGQVAAFVQSPRRAARDQELRGEWREWAEWRQARLENRHAALMLPFVCGYCGAGPAWATLVSFPRQPRLSRRERLRARVRRVIAGWRGERVESVDCVGCKGRPVSNLHAWVGSEVTCRWARERGIGGLLV